MGWFLEAGGTFKIKDKDIFKRNINITEDQISDVRRRFNNKDVYISAYKYNNHDISQSDLYGDLYIDLDYEIHTDADFQKVKRDLTLTVTTLKIFYKIPQEYIKIHFSGNKGFHVTVDPVVFGGEPCKLLNCYYKLIAQDLRTYTQFSTVDTKIYDNKRLFRLPNSINNKTGYYKVPISYEDVMHISLAELAEYAKSPKEIEFAIPKRIMAACDAYAKIIDTYNNQDIRKTDKTFKYTATEVLPCIKEILINGADKGNRNTTTSVLASALFQNGLEFDEVLSTITEWNETKVSPKLSNSELNTTILSMQKMNAQNRSYGCSTIKDLGYCLHSNCKVYNQKNGGKANG